ncbi:hypothetical protein Hanom_Chr00s003574g01713511 [Helianthus anomalus]
MKSAGGRSSADITVTDSTPLIITVRFLRLTTSPSSLPEPSSSTRSRDVIDKLLLNGLVNPFPTPYGQYNSSKCTYTKASNQIITRNYTISRNEWSGLNGLKVYSQSIQYPKSSCDITTFVIIIRVKCHFSPCGLGHFASLVQRFQFSPVGPKRFHHCHFSPLG